MIWLKRQQEKMYPMINFASHKQKRLCVKIMLTGLLTAVQTEAGWAFSALLGRWGGGGGGHLL